MERDVDFRSRLPAASCDWIDPSAHLRVGSKFFSSLFVRASVSKRELSREYNVILSLL